MSAIQEYDCPNCGGPLTFDPSSAAWKCDYCFSKFNKEEIDEIFGQDKQEDATEEKRQESQPEDGTQLEAYHCSSCGAELIADDTTSATFCLYCKSPTIIKQRFRGAFEPKFVIPFRVAKPQATELYRQWIGKKLFAPSSFKQDDEIDKLTGIYAPFWLFDCDAHGRTYGEGTRVSHWRSGNYEYTKTKYYQVEREGNVRYERVPVDASTKLDDKFMNMIEPYDYRELKEFSMTYLTGFMAEKYDVDAEKSERVMDSRVREFVNNRLRETVSGYSSYTPAGTDTDLHDISNNYALMPIYLLVNEYKEEKHMFLINGQTGKIVGETPNDPMRQAGFFGIVFAAVWILTVLGGALFG